MGPVRFLGLETKPNHLCIIKTEPNCLNFMKPFKPDRLEPNHLSYALVAQDDPELWHACFGHLNNDSSYQMVNGVPPFNVFNTSYMDCIHGEHHYEPFPFELIWPHLLWS